jgi:glutamate-1-semialdehyde 2,1-aminomutase
VAVRIARATTDRSKVAICGYHGWADWYLAANLGQDDSLRGHLLPGLEPLGVPRELRGTTAAFRYNDRESFDRMLAEHGEELACIVMEPCRHDPPGEGFLQHVRDEARRVGALLIFDEITIAFRLCFGGAHLQLGVQPDLAIFAKALGNGHPIAAVIGTDDAMAGAQGSFISSTYWTEGVGPAAALATLKKMDSADATRHVQRIGGAIRRTLHDQANRAGVPLKTHGFDSLFAVAFDHDDPLALRTLYTQEMLSRGYLVGGGVYPTLAHTDELIEPFADALAETFAVLAEAVNRNDLRARLAGPVAHSGFQRLT